MSLSSVPLFQSASRFVGVAFHQPVESVHGAALDGSVGGGVRIEAQDEPHELLAASVYGFGRVQMVQRGLQHRERPGGIVRYVLPEVLCEVVLFVGQGAGSGKLLNEPAGPRRRARARTRCPLIFQPHRPRHPADGSALRRMRPPS
jgi:hypothetical protein